MTFSKEENRDSLIWLVRNVWDSLDYHNKAYPDKQMTFKEYVPLYIDNEISMEKELRNCYDAINKICEWNERLLKRISRLPGGKTYVKHLREVIEFTEGVIDGCYIEFITAPVGTFQEEKYGRYIKGIWINQWAVGMEGDSYNGTCCVKIKADKFLKWSWSM